MASPSMVDHLLSVAEKLLQFNSRSAACRRRAVSTAYYAVFHAIAKLCAETLIADAKRNEDAYSRVYRALDHGPLKNILIQAPLKDHQNIKLFGPDIVKLQAERHRADYSPPDKNLFKPSEVKEIIGQARFVIAELDKLSKPDRLLLATCLLFKERKS
jgi:uncharacterized protein (UPF0332 family)